MYKCLRDQWEEWELSGETFFRKICSLIQKRCSLLPLNKEGVINPTNTESEFSFRTASVKVLPLHKLCTEVPIKSGEILSIQPTDLGQVAVLSWSRHFHLIIWTVNQTVGYVDLGKDSVLYTHCANSGPVRFSLQTGLQSPFQTLWVSCKPAVTSASVVQMSQECWSILNITRSLCLITTFEFCLNVKLNPIIVAEFSCFNIGFSCHLRYFWISKTSAHHWQIWHRTDGNQQPSGVAAGGQGGNLWCLRWQKTPTCEWLNRSVSAYIGIGFLQFPLESTERNMDLNFYS